MDSVTTGLEKIMDSVTTWLEKKDPTETSGTTIAGETCRPALHWLMMMIITTLIQCYSMEEGTTLTPGILGYE